MTLDDAKKCAILRIMSGSHLYGLNVEGSDVDERGIMVEPMHGAVGLRPAIEQVEDKAGGDTCIWSLRKYLHLALKGNPSVIELLYAPQSHVLSMDGRGARLRELAPVIASRRAGTAFRGYLHAQRQKLGGDTGNQGKGKPRPKLVGEFGYDTKFAMHMLRLGYMGIEFLQTGKLTLPMEMEPRRLLLDVRAGKFSKLECIEWADSLESDLVHSMLNSPLPADPDTRTVEQWMLRTYFYTWSAIRQREDWPQGGDSLAEWEAKKALNPLRPS